MKTTAQSEEVERRIYMIRGHRVMLDADLAMLYGVATKTLNRAVTRNKERFPDDFMLRLTPEETALLRYQFGTSRLGWGGRRFLPLAFTEQGLSMLSSVLRSKRAILVNIAIMRAFVRLRRLVAANKELADHLANLERQVQSHDTRIQSLFDTIRDLMHQPEAPRRRIGFHPSNRTSPKAKKSA